MRSLDNICSQMELWWTPVAHKFNLRPEINGVREVIIKAIDHRWMVIEFQLDYPNDTVTVSLLENHGFEESFAGGIVTDFVNALNGEDYRF
jgi:hypothetical protein